MEGKAVLDFGSSRGRTATMGWGRVKLPDGALGVTEPREAGACRWGVGQKGSGRGQHLTVFCLPISSTGWEWPSLAGLGFYSQP